MAFHHSIFQDIPDEIMVLIKPGQIIMSAAMDPYQCDLIWI